MAVTKSWKIYGMDGHRQRESFNKSCKYDFSENGKVRMLEVKNSDKTGTNEYSINTVSFLSPVTRKKNVPQSLKDSFPMEFLKIPELGKLWRFKIYILSGVYLLYTAFLMPID